MRRSLIVPLIGLVGLLLAIDGIASWLAEATPWAWGAPWLLGTALLVGAFIVRIGRDSRIAIGAGAAVAILIGVLIALKGEAVTATALDDVPTILAFIVLFIGTVAVGIATLLAGRAGAQGANLWIYVVAGFAVVVLVNFLANRHLGKSVDLTADRLQSLTDQTKAKLAGLDQRVHVIAFMRDDDPGRNDYAVLLKRFADASGHFDFEFVDPDKYPDVAIRESVNPRGTSVIVKSAGRRELVGGPDERDLTSALIKITRPGRKAVYFSTWHDERTLDGDLTALKQYLEQLDYDVRTHRLSDGDIPLDATLFVIAGPRVPFAPIEVERVEKHLMAGNAVLVMLDPDPNPSGLEDLLAKYGVVVEPNVIIERQRGLVPYGGGLYMGEQQSPYVRVRRYGEHEIVRDLSTRGIAVGFYMARGVRTVPPDPSVPEGKPEGIAWAGTQLSFAYNDVKSFLANPRQTINAENAEPGPFAVGAVVTAKANDPLAPTDRTQRLIVFGDADFATDRAISQERGNRDLILNAVNWLTEDEDLIAIQPREPGAKPIYLTSSQGTFLFLFSVWRYPAAILVLGLFIWWYRRSRGPKAQAA